MLSIFRVRIGVLMRIVMCLDDTRDIFNLMLTCKSWHAVVQLVLEQVKKRGESSLSLVMRLKLLKLKIDLEAAS